MSFYLIQSSVPGPLAKPRGDLEFAQRGIWLETPNKFGGVQTHQYAGDVRDVPLYHDPLAELSALHRELFPLPKELREVYLDGGRSEQRSGGRIDVEQ